MQKRYQCQEVECGWSVVKSDDDELIEIVQQHFEEEHASIEMEAVIIANAEQIPE
jgi:predicted small metal-binding protein